jgi:hypothetical protein
MEYRPNSRPERTGPYMTATITDSNPIPRTRDITPNEEREYLMERLVINRVKRLEDDKELD